MLFQCQYDEFKVRINCLVAKSQDVPKDGWRMPDGTSWPGNLRTDHVGMIQVTEPPRLLNTNIFHKVTLCHEVMASSFQFSYILVDTCTYMLSLLSTSVTTLLFL